MHWKWRVRFFMAMLAIFSATGNVRQSKVILIDLFSFSSSSGGFLFGYDTGVVSGAMLLIKKSFCLTPFWQELIVASAIGAAAVAAASGGLLSEAIGRRPVLIIASLVFTAGAVVMAASTGKFVLLGGRDCYFVLFFVSFILLFFRWACHCGSWHWSSCHGRSYVYCRVDASRNERETRRT